MQIDYTAIGKFAVEKSEEYERAMSVYSQLIHDRHELNKRISEAELKNAENLESLYEEFRSLKRDIEANQEYRQKFCDDFLFEIRQKSKGE